ncbi:MAG: peptide chain release factor N(5)-glutamine methyltransferase [Gammaproteobacteria bacterium]|nr:peptide chain release factor N(5)-glutamine methyltransferase [Gammaproteobacteria bacterium]
MTSVAATLEALTRTLAPVGAGARLEAGVLLAHALGCSRAALLADPARPLTAAEDATLAAFAGRRLAGKPVAYLTGRREFWSLEFEVTPAVLVPRPETELLVELALRALTGRHAPAVLDLGTGSGALALALARERPDAAIVAVERSPEALAVARRNAARLGCDQVRFVAGSWYEPLAGQRFALVVANPPYIASDDPALLTLRHEPRGALDGGADGLAALRLVCAGAVAHLQAGGTLIVEHGATQGPAVRALCRNAGLAGAATHRDLAGHERATQAAAPG